MNSEQLQKWALLAEVIGAAAVVITLIFLIVETRENTNAIQSQTYQALTAELNRSRSLFQEPEEAELLKWLVLYPDYVQNSFKNFKPNIMAGMFVFGANISQSNDEVFLHGVCFGEVLFFIVRSVLV